MDHIANSASNDAVPTPAQCPLHASGIVDIAPGTELVLPLHRRMIAHYTTHDDGSRELCLYYGEKEISFDEEELFTFGETLARQPRFIASDAQYWAEGLAWPRVRELLTQLVEEGVLVPAAEFDRAAHGARGGVQPAPLPPGPATEARSWLECETITLDLCGRALALEHLELVVPIFRVAHCALDREGRQVGEANVFPPALRLAVPTEWRTCPHAGSRHLSERPMNVSALGSMRAMWPAMMTVLRAVRAHYLARFPDAALGWTVGHLERLATVVLALPSYQLMRMQGGVPNGDLHPVLSSVFRVADGLRMTMHQMLFIPIGEAALPADAPMTAAEVIAYAERNYAFHSEHGVCAGPRAMIEEFLAVLLDGAGSDAPQPLDVEVTAVLAHIDDACSYGLHGLRAYAVVFSLWPAMVRSYQELADALERVAQDDSEPVAALRGLVDDAMRAVRERSYLANESWRHARDRAYGDMYERCSEALDDVSPEARVPLAQLLAVRPAPCHEPAANALRLALARRLGSAHADLAATLHGLVFDYLCRAQAVVRAAEVVQSDINRTLGRGRALHPFTLADIDLHNQLQVTEGRRVPFLSDALGEWLDVEIMVTADAIDCLARRASTQPPATKPLARAATPPRNTEFPQPSAVGNTDRIALGSTL